MVEKINQENSDDLILQNLKIISHDFVSTYFENTRYCFFRIFIKLFNI